MIATVTSKGQVTLPAEARRRLGIRPGSKLEIIIKNNDRMEVIVRSGSIRDLKGVVPRPGKTLSIDEMKKAVAKGAAKSLR